MSKDKPWLTGKALIWSDNSSKVFSNRQIVVLDKGSQILWYYDHKAHVFSGAQVQSHQLKVSALPVMVQRALTEVGVESLMKTPPDMIRMLEQIQRPSLLTMSASLFTSSNDTATS